MTVGRRVIYRGRVQGVGFRYTAHRIAAGFDIGGYVKNLPDGSVELVVEGLAESVERYLATVAGRMGPNIEDQSQTDVPLTGIQGFQIRH
jgi:acylphosphatase